MESKLLKVNQIKVVKNLIFYVTDKKNSEFVVYKLSWTFQSWIFELRELRL